MNDSRSASTHTAGDLTYDAFLIGLTGGSIVALFFLAYDFLVHGEPFFTPSFMGSVLFDGLSPNSVHAVNLNAVTKYTLVHFVSFGILGLALSFLTHRAEIRARHPLFVIFLAFVVLEVAFWIGTAIVIPGVIQRIGLLPVAAANLLAAVGIGLFLVSSHRTEPWARFLRAAKPGGTNRD